MKERRNIFAKDYIDETIDSFIECNEKFINDEQIDWAYQVLEKYFDLVDLKVLEKQYSKFKSSFCPSGQRRPHREAGWHSRLGSLKSQR